MESFHVAQQARIYAKVARLVAMQTENEARKVRGETPAYTEDSFYAIATGLDALADQCLQYP